jgi:hypothetical protein
LLLGLQKRGTAAKLPKPLAGQWWTEVLTNAGGRIRLANLSDMWRFNWLLAMNESKNESTAGCDQDSADPN